MLSILMITSCRVPKDLTVHEVAKSWTQLSDFTLTFHFHALEKEMATHSSILAWRIPGMAEPGKTRAVTKKRLESPVAGRGREDFALAAAAAAAKSLQSCLTLCDPIDGSPPGPAVPGIL